MIKSKVYREADLITEYTGNAQVQDANGKIVPPPPAPAPKTETLPVKAKK